MGDYHDGVRSLGTGGAHAKNPILTVVAYQYLYKTISATHGDGAVQKGIGIISDSVRYIVGPASLLIEAYSRHFGIKKHDGGHVAVAQRVFISQEHGFDRIPTFHFRYIIERRMLRHIANGKNAALDPAIAIGILASAGVDFYAHVFQSQFVEIGYTANGYQGYIDL
jgi:hypothetical protein